MRLSCNRKRKYICILTMQAHTRGSQPTRFRAEVIACGRNQSFPSLNLIVPLREVSFFIPKLGWRSSPCGRERLEFITRRCAAQNEGRNGARKHSYDGESWCGREKGDKRREGNKWKAWHDCNKKIGVTINFDQREENCPRYWVILCTVT